LRLVNFIAVPVFTWISVWFDKPSAPHRRADAVRRGGACAFNCECRDVPLRP